MKRLLIFFAGIFLLAAAVAVAAEKPAPFNPTLYSAENLPPGILYIDSGTVNFVTPERVVVDDANYPFSANMRVFNREGVKAETDTLKAGQQVDLFANDKHEAVYVVIK
jgi:hypothetical protein